MIGFYIKGLLRDRHRSLFPVLIVLIGVMITTTLHCYMTGMFGQFIADAARFDTGHVKVTTRAYADFAGEFPNDLAIDNADSVTTVLRERYPELLWEQRIKFGGLLDFSDSLGNPISQGPVMGIATDLMGRNDQDIDFLNLNKALRSGRLPEKPGEALAAARLLEEFNQEIGAEALLVTGSATGGMAIFKFEIVGTIEFGIPMLDRNLIVVDLQDARWGLDMMGWSGEILGYQPKLVYDDKKALTIKNDFNSAFEDTTNEYSTTMNILSDNPQLGVSLKIAKIFVLILIMIFVFAMSIVLWNTGLLQGIRRYGEFGVRLAMGESKTRVYLGMVYESIVIGIIGSVIGTAIGLGISYYLQEVGIDMTKAMRQVDMVVSGVLHAKITPLSFFIGFVPGLMATIFGAVFSGLGIFKRQTAQLFKELEE
ncbi:MAG: FtsX-like permease family protein [Calditrichaeota bacterium]|nr:FtsX-like permease family protein [Calditrichota bacterium]MBT7790115.1 FtsX-like permease family protein [Calditrichota bacterium]